MIQVRRRLARNHPHVQRQQEKVRKALKRNFKKPRLTAAKVKKQLKTVKRKKVTEELYFMEIVDEMEE
jgi:hypothetical protein